MIRESAPLVGNFRKHTAEREKKEGTNERQQEKSAFGDDTQQHKRRWSERVVWRQCLAVPAEKRVLEQIDLKQTQTKLKRSQSGQCINAILVPGLATRQLTPVPSNAQLCPSVLLILRLQSGLGARLRLIKR